MNASARYVMRRLAAAIPVLFGVAVLTFVLVRVLPGDPAIHFSTTAMGSQADVEALRRELGLDQPLAKQFASYLARLAQADLGRSLATGNLVVKDLAARLPASLELTGFALVVALAVSIPWGLAAALRQGSAIDHAARVVSAAMISIPTFVTGLLLIHIFYYVLGWAPEPTGRLDAFMDAPRLRTGLLVVDSIAAGQWHVLSAALAKLLLPAVCMALFAIAPVLRTTRGAVLAVMSSDYVRTAVALGLPRRRLLLSYVLMNAMVPVLTVTGMVVSFMLGANVLVEKIFAWPGVGSYALDALLASDYAAVQGYVLLMALLFVAVNLVVDLLNGMIDPRLRAAA